VDAVGAGGPGCGLGGGSDGVQDDGVLSVMAHAS